MNDLDHQLEDQLHTSAARLDLPMGDLDRVIARTRTRRRHQQALVATTLVVALVAVLARVETNGSSGRPVNVRPAGALSGDVHAGDAGVVWQRVDPHSPLAYLNSAAAGGSLYALSTSPGVSNTDVPTPQQLYRSSDGEEWAPVASPTGTYLSDLAASGNQLYAVGTGVATAAAVTPFVVDSSSDGGATWNRLALPIDLGALQANMLDPHSGAIQVASSAKGVVVVVQAASELDVPKFLPAGVTAPNGWAITATGVDLLGPIDQPACPAGMSAFPANKGIPPITVANAGNDAPPTVVGPTPCYSGADPTFGATTLVAPQANHPVTHSFTWAQLGVSAPLAQAASGHPFVFFSADGTSFQTLTLPNLPASVGQVQVVSDDNSFAIAAVSSASPSPAAPITSGDQSVFWQSQDGVTWTSTPPLPADVGYASAVGYTSGNLTVVGGGVATGSLPGEATVATLRAGSWSDASLSGVLGTLPTGATASPSAAAIGPFGIAVDVAVIQDPIAAAGGVTIDSGGYHLRIMNEGWAASVTDSTGKVVGVSDSLRRNLGGDLRVDPSTQTVTLVDGTGKTLATFDDQQVNQVIKAKAGSGISPTSDHMLVSRDGSVWSDQALTQLTGQSGGSVANIVVAANRFIVTAQFPRGDANPPRPAAETVLVGTAR